MPTKKKQPENLPSESSIFDRAEGPSEEPHRALVADDLRRARLPENYWRAEWASCTESIMSYVDGIDTNLHNGRGLILIGGHGVGKTFAAAALLKEALRCTRRCMFMWAPDVVNAYKPGAPMYDDDYTLVEAMESRVLLVIDDLGNEYRGAQSGFAEQHIVNLYRSRCSRKRATILTTNLKLDEIENTYGPGFRSLLAEFALAVHMGGPDRRKKKSD